MLEKVYSLCLKGNVTEAYEYLQELEQNKTVERLTKQYYNRFFSEKPKFRYKSKDSWIKNVIHSYYEYYISVLTKEKSTEEAEITLFQSLLSLLNDSDQLKDMDKIEELLAEQFQKRGYYFLGGVTQPYRGPYIWKQQEKVDYTILLPSGYQKVSVYFLSDFIIQSWLHFATFGKLATGGWATKDALYCVKDRYKKGLDTPDFVYSYLTHEAQHFVDYREFPSLDARELEYRAKLVELIYHPFNNKRLIKKFLTQADKNNPNPHSHASFAVCTNLSKLIFEIEMETDLNNWRKINPKTLSSHALALFHLHTDLLTNQRKSLVDR